MGDLSKLTGWRYGNVHIFDQETEFARWIVEAWEQLLVRHFRSDLDPGQEVFDPFNGMVRDGGQHSAEVSFWTLTAQCMTR